MILFIAPNPKDVTIREGFLQRVWAIDQLFADEERLYWHDLNTLEKAQALQKSRVVYVHSLYQAQYIRSNLESIQNKVILDLHGIVPEEEAYTGNNQNSTYYNQLEAAMFKHSYAFVSVTKAMKQHYINKYRIGSRKRWAVLPIFDNAHVKPEYSLKDDTNIVYSGGTQPWQNIPQMIDFIDKSDIGATFTILTHDQAAFKDVKQKDGVIIESVKSDRVQDYYRKASFGFILRDDNEVNRVACPTKLVEYLSNGVIPIVKSERIGDFPELNYAYTRPDMLKERLHDHEWIKQAITHNLKVFDELIKVHLSGTKQLKQITDSISRTKRMAPEVNVLGVEYDANLVELREAQRLIEHQQQVVKDYADMVDFYKTKLDSIPKRRFTHQIMRLAKKIKETLG